MHDLTGIETRLLALGSSTTNGRTPEGHDLHDVAPAHLMQSFFLRPLGQPLDWNKADCTGRRSAVAAVKNFRRARGMLPGCLGLAQEIEPSRLEEFRRLDQIAGRQSNWERPNRRINSSGRWPSARTFCIRSHVTNQD